MPFKRIPMKLKIIALSVSSGLLLGALIIPLAIHEKNGRTKREVAEIRDLLYGEFDRSIQQQVENTLSLIQTVHARQVRGELKEDAARALAASLIRELKFGDGGYFWVDTFDGVNVVYAGKDAEGKSRWEAKDAHGKLFIQEIIANGRKAGGGFTNYDFPRKGGSDPLPKRSYSIAFEPYHWVLGSGNYVDDIEAKISEKRLALEKENRDEIVQQVTMAISVMVLTILLSSFFAARIASRIHDISIKLIEGTSELRSSISRILSVAHDLAHLATQQASAVQETAAAIEQISTTIRRSSESAEQSEKISTSSRDKAMEGQHIVRRMSDSMGKIVQGNEAVASTVDQGNSKMNEIAQMITNINQKTSVINGIVFQTKLLSFNASIEAARAGEQGKGFSVVAQEVGSLAQVSGNAAQDISRLLDQSTSQVHRLVEETKSASLTLIQSANQSVREGNEIVSECEQVLQDIVRGSDEVSSAITQIVSASKEQSIAVAEVAKAMQEIDRTTQVASSSGKVSAEAADNLAEKTKRISSMAASLESLLAGHLVLPKFNWVPEFSIGIDAMDAQHLELIQRMNTLAETLERHERRRNAPPVVEAFQRLIEYTRFHFEEEERFMQSFDYESFDRHQKIHHDLLGTLDSFSGPVKEGTVDPNELMEFLIDWLIHHILNSDKMYASDYRLRAAG